MSFELHHLPLATPEVFRRRLVTTGSVGLALVAASLAIGIAGYVFFEHLSVVDAFLNAAMILSLAGKKRHGLRRAWRREVDFYKPGFDPLSTTRLFSTLNTPGTWPARMPAICLSIALSTVPYRLTWPPSMMMRIGRAGSSA